LNKFDIFTLCSFHSENNKIDCDVMFLIMTLCCVNILKPFRFETCVKTKENVINRTFNALSMNMEFISLIRQDFYNIFTRASHSWKYKKSCLTREINSIFIKKHWISSIYNQLINHKWNTLPSFIQLFWIYYTISD
jgi:hypothetical protein